MEDITKVFNKVKKETKDLDKKINNLKKFINSEKFNNELTREHKILLRMQYNLMVDYFCILNTRLDLLLEDIILFKKLEDNK